MVLVQQLLTIFKFCLVFPFIVLIRPTQPFNKVLRLSGTILVGNNCFYFPIVFLKLFYCRGLKPRACPIRLQQGDIEDRVEPYHSGWELQLICLLPYALQDLEQAYKFAIKLFVGAFYTDILREEQNLFTNGKVFGQVVTIIVFYLKLLGVYY